MPVDAHRLDVHLDDFTGQQLDVVVDVDHRDHVAYEQLDDDVVDVDHHDQLSTVDVPAGGV